LAAEPHRCAWSEAGSSASRFKKDGEVLGISADAVVIADGEFPANAELFRQYTGPRPDRVLMRHAGIAIGTA